MATARPGASDADLLSLAGATNLRIIAFARDAETTARFANLSGMRIYGSRVAVLTGMPAPSAAFISQALVAAGSAATEVAEDVALLQSLFASVRPYGGALALELDGTSQTGFALPEGAQVERSGNLTLLRRPGPLPGTDNWNHQYGNPANTVSSRDSLVKAPLGLLWFGGPSNLDILPRHGHGPPEQVVDGRLFIEGPDSLRANDVYTGRELWKIELPELGEYYDRTYHQPGANALGTNFVVTSDTVYVVYRDHCIKLDPASGSRLGEIELPPVEADAEKPTGWGFIAVQDDVIVAGASPMYFDGKGKPGDMDNWDGTTSRQSSSRPCFRRAAVGCRGAKWLPPQRHLPCEGQAVLHRPPARPGTSDHAAAGRRGCHPAIPPRLRSAHRARGMEVGRRRVRHLVGVLD